MAEGIANQELGRTRKVSGERERLVRYLLAEENSAALYHALAALERDPGQTDVYLRLADSECDHASYWRARLLVAGHDLPKHALSLRTRLLIHLARWFGNGFVIPSIAMRERGDHEHYAGQRDASEAGLVIDEHSHAEILRALTGPTIGTNLRAAVLGANDGLVSNFCLMMGMVGGRAGGKIVVLAGIAGHGEAWSAARFSFSLFAIGAAVPILPFAILVSGLAIAGSMALSLTAIAFLGLATSLFNGKPGWFSATRQVVIGTAAAVVTYGIGRFVALAGG